MRSPSAPAVVALAIAAMSLTACLPKAMRLNPLDPQMARMSAAVAIPNSYALASGDVVMTLAFRPDDASAPIVETFPLEIVRSNLRPGLQPGRDEAVFVGKLAGNDVARFEATQARIRSRRAATTGKGSFSISVKGLCAAAGTPVKDLPVRTFVTASGDSFSPLAAHRNLFDALNAEQRAALKSQIRRCAA